MLKKYVAMLIAAAALIVGDSASANLPMPMCAPFTDSGGYSFDGGTNYGTSAGTVCLAGNNTMWVRTKYYSGPKAGTIEWQQITAPIYTYSYPGGCQWTTTTTVWQQLTPYSTVGNLYGGCSDYTCAYGSGKFRILGDGGSTAVPAGVEAADTSGRVFVLVIATQNIQIGTGDICGNNTGVATVGRWYWIQYPQAVKQF